MALHNSTRKANFTGQEVSKSDAERLREEFGNLVNSAAQELATQAPTSTATPFDQWHYIEDTIEYSKQNQKKRKAAEWYPSAMPFGDNVAAVDSRPRKRRRCHNKTWRIKDCPGEVHISLPHSLPTVQLSHGTML
ncbi:hypothetical protein CC86DRAFT_383783 [Ophiobolus disseminans]|uniref:Uncharacterized protein n=1 Tax=Ophiobolus disseminans TaxID=1469910 RepID=A0A6A6ZVI4_9PLEO|nr:hypothetical protein CC86DRAFT_383783 [Ophiobolus disseminans]